MDKRIKELAEQCTSWSDGSTWTSREVFDKEKFAKLILTDVVETIKQSAGSHLMLNANEMEVKEIQLKVEGALAAMAAVSRYFKD